MSVIRQKLIEDFIQNISELADQENKDRRSELDLAGRAILYHAIRYRSKQSYHNWWKSENSDRHVEMAMQEITPEDLAHLDTLNGSAKGLYKMILAGRVCHREWNALSPAARLQTTDDFESAQTESTFVNPSTAAPRSPSKRKLNSIAKTRKDGMKCIENLITSTVLFAEDHGFDVACYLSDKTMHSDGGVQHQQFGTTTGLHFVSYLHGRGISGEFLQILSHSSHLQLLPAVARTAHVPANTTAVTTIDDVFPALAPPTRSNLISNIPRGRQSLCQCKNLLLREAIRAHAELPLYTKELHNIKQDPQKFRKDLQDRGLEIVICDAAGLSVKDVIDNSIDLEKLRKVYSALMLDQITIRPIPA